MDQMAVLQWVQENAAGFGGDTKRVTLFGHGTGAACIEYLVHSPTMVPGKSRDNNYNLSVKLASYNVFFSARVSCYVWNRCVNRTFISPMCSYMRKHNYSVLSSYLFGRLTPKSKKKQFSNSNTGQWLFSNLSPSASSQLALSLSHTHTRIRARARAHAHAHTRNGREAMAENVVCMQSARPEMWSNTL